MESDSRLKNSKLKELMSVLAHKIRTPLSVIQNELSCLKEKLEPEEYQRILSACKSISGILKENPEILLKISEEDNNE